MADDLLGRIGNLLNKRPWYKLPRLLAMGRLVEIRNELRQKNLHDTEEPPFECLATPVTPTPEQREGRTLDGTFNDLTCPSMGAVGARFGRNFPLEHVFPDTPNLFVPNPRVVSRELMTPAPEYDSVHVNAEFTDQASDHDPQVARVVVRGTNNAK